MLFNKIIFLGGAFPSHLNGSLHLGFYDTVLYIIKNVKWGGIVKPIWRRCHQCTILKKSFCNVIKIAGAEKQLEDYK